MYANQYINSTTLPEVIKASESYETIRLAVSYVYWYNLKYQRQGYLFQDRFKSEPVDSDRYFLTVLRYIHQNSAKAGLVKSVSVYPYSNYGEYLNNETILNRELLFSMISCDDFKSYNNEITDEICLDISEKRYCISSDGL